MSIEKFRKGLILLSVGVSTYYIVWRLQTLNGEAPLFSSVLYGAELYGLLTSLMFFYMVWKFPERKTRKAPDDLKVDVYIPTLNEGVDILRKTIRGALDIAYPHKTYVLDDGDRPEVKRLCEELGCGYILREDNTHGKAGNLNNALSRTDGELIAVFDADHVPEPDFLDRTLGYFADEKVAFVQTPQDFYNIDSYQHRVVKGKLWNEQSLFFRVIMRGKDRHNSAFFCGSCAVVRRKALQSIGGFATGTVTEDLHTSIRLHAKGWRSVYHPETLAYGLAPSRLSPYKNQRDRWGQGAMQVFFRDNPFLIRGLSVHQRLNYFASMVTYFDGFQKAVFYSSPVVVLLTGKLPISVGLYEFLPVFIPHIVLSLWAFEEASRGYGKLALLEQYNMARFFTFMKSVLGFLNLKKPSFKVTDKENARKTGFKELIPQAIVLGGSAVGIGYGLARLPEALNKGVYTANILWAGLNLFIASAYVLWTTKKSHDRSEFRFPANFPAILGENGDRKAVTVEDLNGGGAAVLTDTWLNPDESVILSIQPEGENIEVKGRVVYSRKAGSGGLFRSGIAFESMEDKTRKEIEVFNFRFALKRYMEEHDRPAKTPFQALFDLFSRKKHRGTRIRLHAPGLVSSGNARFPYTLEDVSEGGMRILTQGRLVGRQVSIRGSHAGKGTLKGEIVWAREVSFYGIKAYRYGISVSDDEREVLEFRAQRRMA
ncbi:glycosyltransferase [Hydrogenivirga sp.]